jgi:hypothetical protein
MKSGKNSRRTKTQSLATQINAAENQILHRQRLVNINAAYLNHKIRQQLTTPTSFLLAVGMGYILGDLTQKGSSSKVGATANKPQATEISPLTTALRLVTSIHSLYMALPIAWIMKSFQQRKPSESGSGRRRTAKHVDLNTYPKIR